MLVDQLLQNVVEGKAELEANIVSALEAFKHKTGLPVNSLIVSFIDTTTMSDGNPSFVVGKIQIGVEF